MRHPNHDDPNQSRAVGNQDGGGHPHHYDPNQPRVPAGHHDGGQWTGGGSAGPGKVQLALAGDPRRVAIQYVVQKAIEAGLAAYTALSAYNSRRQRAIIEVQVKAQQFHRDDYPGSQFNFNKPQFLTQQQVGNICDKLGKIQELTNEAVDSVRDRRSEMTSTQYGTAVHKWVKDHIGSDPDFVAEESLVKLAEETRDKDGNVYSAEEADYGDKDSIRVDVLERKDSKTVCVYDIKTGKRGLSFNRLLDIVDHVHGTYPTATDIIITEVRPSDPWRPTKRPRLRNQ